MTYFRSDNIDSDDWDLSPEIRIDHVHSTRIQLPDDSAGESSSNEIHCGEVELSLVNSPWTALFTIIPYDVSAINSNPDGKGGTDSLVLGDIVQHEGVMHKLTGPNLYDSIAYDSEVTYAHRDMVFNNGALYVCLESTSDEPTALSEKWHDMTKVFLYKGSKIVESYFPSQADFQSFVEDNIAHIDATEYSPQTTEYVWTDNTFGEILQGVSGHSDFLDRTVVMYIRSLVGSGDNTQASTFGDPFIVPMLD